MLTQDQKHKTKFVKTGIPRYSCSAKMSHEKANMLMYDKTLKVKILNLSGKNIFIREAYGFCSVLLSSRTRQKITEILKKNDCYDVSSIFITQSYSMQKCSTKELENSVCNCKFRNGIEKYKTKDALRKNFPNLQIMSKPENKRLFIIKGKAKIRLFKVAVVFCPEDDLGKWENTLCELEKFFVPLPDKKKRFIYSLHGKSMQEIYKMMLPKV